MTYFLIGGKENKIPLDNLIEKHLLSLVDKEKPLVVFCPYATANDYQKSIDKFLPLFQNLSCDIYCMTAKDYDHFQEIYDKADIFYIGGGHCDDLVKLFNDKGFAEILRNDKSNKIVGGVSAGAMLISKIAMGDKYTYTDNSHIYNYKMVKCLDILNISICPHYNHEDLIIYNDEVKNLSIPSFAIEDGTCLIFKNDEFYAIKDNKRMSAYYFKADTHKMIPLYENVKYSIEGD